MSGRIAPQLIRNQLPRRRTLSPQQFAKEPPRSLFVSSLRHQNVENIAVLIDGALQIPLLSLDLDEDFIDMPDVPQSTLFLSEPSSVFRSELQTPETDGFVRNNDPTLSQQILDIPKAEGKTMVEPDRMTDDLGRETMAFIAGAHSPILADHADLGST